MIIGILPPGTPWLDAGDVFVPLVRTPKEDRGSFELSAIGRLQPGVPAAQGLADLTRISRVLERQFPDVNKGHTLVMESSSTWVAGDTTRRALWILMGAVGCLLLIASVNLVNLLLAQATGARARLRCGRPSVPRAGRIVRQLVVESMLLGGLGSAAGLLTAFRSSPPLRSADVGIARLAYVTVDARVLPFTILVGLSTSVATGPGRVGLAGLTGRAGSRAEGRRARRRGISRQRRVRQVLWSGRKWRWR